MHVCSSIAKFSAPLPNTFVTHKVWSIHCTHSAMNISCTMAFSLQKTDHCVNLALARSFYSSTHVNMLIAQWELSVMAGRVVWDEAIVYRSVLCQCQVPFFTGLPTLAHRTLISEYASYFIFLSNNLWSDIQDFFVSLYLCSTAVVQCFFHHLCVLCRSTADEYSLFNNIFISLIG